MISNCTQRLYLIPSGIYPPLFTLIPTIPYGKGTNQIVLEGVKIGVGLFPLTQRADKNMAYFCLLCECSLGLRSKTKRKIKTQK